MFGHVLLIAEYTSYDMQKWRNNLEAFTDFYSVIFKTEDRGKRHCI